MIHSIILLAIVIICIGWYVGDTLLWKYREKVSRRDNKDYYIFREDYFKQSEKRHIAYLQIQKIRTDIDALIKEMPFLTSPLRQQAEIDLEMMRENLHNCLENEYNPLNVECKTLRERLTAWEKQIKANGYYIF